ncbi:MAG: right-handed parallel beta-helix repeat-containing protein [Cellulosilyticum sp.]|nr:right-handed parallel beta-helix repeat-containing protein [Cellulosilyticum sp.]
MSSTNKTTYYELPQYVDNDLFNPLVDDNDAYAKIDTALHDIADAEASDASEITGVKSRVTTAEGKVASLETQNGSEILATTAQTLSGAVNELDGDVVSLDSRLDTAEDDINNANTGLKAKVVNLDTRMSTAEGDIDDLEAQNGSETLITTAQTLSGGINEIIGDVNKIKYFKTPEMFGAVGDGVNDDTQALKDCFVGGGYIYLSKTYKITDTITVESNTTVYGSEKSLVHMVSETMRQVFDCSDTENTMFDGIIIEGSEHWDGQTDARAQIESGLYYGGTLCKNIIIKNCKFTKLGQSAIYLFITENVLIDNCYMSYKENPAGSFPAAANYNNGIRVYRKSDNLTITNCEIWDVAIGIYLPHHGGNMKVDNCYIHNISAQHAFYCAVGDCTISNCVIADIEGGAIGLQFDDSSDVSNFTRLINNRIERTSSAITIRNVYDDNITFFNVIVDGNYISDCLNGIQIVKVGNITISNNMLESMKQHGILLTGHNEQVMIDNNIIHNCGQDERAGYTNGIEIIDNDGVIIKNNNIISDDHKMAVGIMCDSRSVTLNVEVLNNVIKGASSFSIREISATSITCCEGNSIDGATLPSPIIAKGETLARYTNSSEPSTGSHIKGEIVYNSNPSAGGNIGWVCVTSGSPGTWKAFGSIEA